VILREIRTRPGMLFSRSDIIRSQRDIIQLGYFDQEKIDIVPTPNAADGTVDLEYIVAETSSDQIELSGGWGANQIIGTLGLSFNNFSTRNFFKKDAWRPLPSGDGQRLTLRAQTYGRGYVSYSMSFMEPWLGGRKPNAFSVSIFQTTHRNRFPRSSPDYGYYSIIGTSVGLAQRLRVPDDWFYLRQTVGFQRYEVLNSPYGLLSMKEIPTTSVTESNSEETQLMRPSTHVQVRRFPLVCSLLHPTHSSTTKITRK
jgi:outer membrane protein insertion porin family